VHQRHPERGLVLGRGVVEVEDGDADVIDRLEHQERKTIDRRMPGDPSTQASPRSVQA